MAAVTRYQQGGFTFRALDDINLSRMTSKKLNYCIAESSVDYRQEVAHFRGALLRLFGPPEYVSTWSDSAFDYIIEARDESDHHWILTAYEGPSGPAVGGKMFDETVQPAAQALASLIRATSPEDFDETVYDDDLDWTVAYGVRNGEYYYREVRGNQILGKSSDAP